MDTFLGRFKNLIVLAAILFAQVIGLAVQVRRPSDEGETRLLRIWVISAVTPIEKAVVHSQEWVGDIFKNYAYLRGVRRENRDLRDQMEQMKMVQVAAGSAFLNTKRPMGSQARGETGRSKLMMGSNMRLMKVKRPRAKPRGMPTRAAKPKPRPTRFREE